MYRYYLNGATSLCYAEVLPYQSIGVTYNGLHSTTNPNVDDINADLSAIQSYRNPQGDRFTSIRTYYPQYNGNIGLMPLIDKYHLKTLLGLYVFPDHASWTDGNYTSYVKPYLENQNILGILVGNEDYNTSGASEIINKYLIQIKSDAPNVPVSSAQTTDFWLNDPNALTLASKCDFIAVNIYPNWNWNNPDTNNQPQLQSRTLTPESGALSPQQGFENFQNQYNAIAAKYPGKQVVVTETGWPTTYGWVVNVPYQPKQYQVGLDNAQSYLKLIKDWSDKNKVVVYYYSMFDDWYGVNTTSQYNMHFGLLDTYRNTKVTN